MGNKKIKEDDKIERTIRALLKLPENRRCINCNLLGPQYVCTTFLTFVCTACSGIHREFTHRVKSVSMAKFSEEEVSSLQAAGNERAREIYFKAWDPQRHSLPDGSNLHKLREFIKHVYVDRKYAGERNDKLPSLRLGHSMDSSDNRKLSIFSGRSDEGSNPSGKGDVVRGFYNETRSPRHPQENTRYGGSRRSPMCIEIVDNRVRIDGPGSARRHDNHSFSRREPITRSRSSDHRDRSSSLVVRPVRDFLGEKALALQVDEHSKAKDAKDSDGSDKNQKTAPSMGSLIDFDMDSEPPNSVAAPNMQQVPPSSDGGNQSSNELSSKEKDSLEFLLFDLSAPSVLPVDNVSAVPHTAGAPSTALGVQNIPLDNVSPAAPAEQLLALPSTNCSSTVPPVTNIPQNPSNVGPLQSVTDSYAQQSFSLYNQQSSQATSKSAEETSFEVGVQPLSAETKPSGRMELPEDLFTASYVPAPATAVPSWQNGLPYGTGFGLQYYPNAMHAAAIPSTAKTANPFDINSDTTSVQPPPFPSVASCPGALTSLHDPTGLSHTHSFGTHSSGTASHSSLMNLESHFTSAMPSSAYRGGHSHVAVPSSSSRPQGNGSFDSDGFVSGSLSTTARPTGGHSASNPPNSFPTVGGNPFG